MLRTAERLKAALLRANAQEIERIVRAFNDTVFTATLADREALLALVEQEGMTIAKLKRSAVFRRLVANTDEQLAAYSAYLLVEMKSIIRHGVELGTRDAKRLITAGGEMLGVSLTPEVVPLKAAIQAMNLLQPTGPLYNKLQQYGTYNAAKIAEGILDAVIKGKHPKQMAYEITRLYGMPLNDALRLTRTAQLYSYRRASHLNYAANPKIVPGWIWYAKLDGDTCLSCWAQHGSFHEHDEELNDHHQGRCAPLPAVLGFNPVLENGEQAFLKLSESEQASMMGPGRYQAWKDGKFEFWQNSGTHLDDVYGEMRVVAPLKDLLS
jgi:hypothetical protein